MNTLYVLGDINTVTVFRLAGIEGIEAAPGEARRFISELTITRETSVILLTQELSNTMPDLVKQVNLSPSGPVIIEIPGIDEAGGFGKSAMDYITEALGIAL